MHDLLVLHKVRPILDSEFSLEGWLKWQTCLRTLWLGYGEEQWCDHLERSGCLRGPGAYQLLLEIGCGLHSPVVGETEVFGQLKEFTAGIDKNLQISAVLRELIRDIKDLRHKHLAHLGSQTYGSVTRRWLVDASSIHVIGAGQLAREILPWITRDGVAITIHARSPERAEHFLREKRHVVSLSLSRHLRGGLIIVAPLASGEVSDWCRMGGHQFDKIIDLRHDSDQDRLDLGAPVRTLSMLFAEIKATGGKIEKRIQALKSDLNEVVAARASAEKIRPLGWDDLCA